MPSRRIFESTDQGGSYGRYGYGDQPRCGVPERHEYDDDQRGAHNYDDKYEYEYEGGCSRGGERERGDEGGSFVPGRDERPHGGAHSCGDQRDADSYDDDEHEGGSWSSSGRSDMLLPRLLGRSVACGKLGPS